jgi:glucosylceramidase
VPIYALTLQNEPHFEPKDYPGMRVDPAKRAAFIGGHLGPVLAKSIRAPASSTGITTGMNLVASRCAQRRHRQQIRGGVAWHCYGGDVRVQAALHDRWPDKETFSPNARAANGRRCGRTICSTSPGTLVIGTTRGWAKGVLLWNLALDENDGPHLAAARTAGVVTIDSRDGKITRNEEYYALAHASRFVRQGAHRIASTSGYGDLDTVAFRNADDGSTAR